jgi:hypothetical protein
MERTTENTKTATDVGVALVEGGGVCGSVELFGLESASGTAALDISRGQLVGEKERDQM